MEPPASPFPNHSHPDIGAGSSRTEVWGFFFGFTTICLARSASSPASAVGQRILMLAYWSKSPDRGVTPCLQRRRLWGREEARLEHGGSAGASSRPLRQPSVGSCPFDEPWEPWMSSSRFPFGCKGSDSGGGDGVLLACRCGSLLRRAQDRGGFGREARADEPG